MSRFSIDTEAALLCKGSIDKAETDLRRYSMRVGYASQTIQKVMSGSTGYSVSSSLSKAAERLLDEAARMDSLGNALLKIVTAYKQGDEAATELVKSIVSPGERQNARNGDGDTGEKVFSKIIKKAREIIQWIADHIFPKKTPEQIAKEREKAHDLAMQDAVFDLLNEDRFSKKRWNKATLDERKQIIEDLIAALAITMGIPKPSHLEIYPFDDPSTTGYHSYAYDTIAINETYLTRKDSYSITQTVIHEMRHAYQHEVVDHPENFQVTEETVEAWKNNFDNYRDPDIYGYDSYVTQPVEWDAKNFAKQKRDVKGYKPDYAGSW